MERIETDILIVGAGLAGASTAYHLGRTTDLRVILVDQEATPGVHSSGRNAAIIRQYADDPAWRSLLTEGAAFLRGGELASYERRGLMLLGLGDDDVTPRFPRARGTGAWRPDDGTVDVAALLQAYLAGQDVRFETKVFGWSRVGDGLRVETDHGDIRCCLLVNAAGPWAGTLGELPLTPMNRHLFVTGPMDWVDAGWPCVWDGPRGLYFRPESGGLLLCCCDETPAEPGDYREDLAVLERLAGNVSDQQPGLGELAIRRQWVGQRTFAPDRAAVIGPDPRNDRVFHVAGLGGHGVTASYAVGRLAAKMICGRDAESFDAYSPSRLLKQDAHSRRTLHADCR